MRVNFWAIIVAAIAAFILSLIYYSPVLLGNVWRAVDPVATAGAKPSMAKAFIEIARTIVIAFVIARLVTLLGGSDLRSALQLALWFWFGFSAMMWVGAIMWEKTPW